MFKNVNSFYKLHKNKISNVNSILSMNNIDSTLKIGNSFPNNYYYYYKYYYKYYMSIHDNNLDKDTSIVNNNVNNDKFFNLNFDNVQNCFCVISTIAFTTLFAINIPFLYKNIIQ